MYEYPQHTHEFDPQIDTMTNLTIIHAPNSLIDLRRNDKNNVNFKYLDNSQKFGLKKSEEVYKDELMNKINKTIQFKDKDTYESIKTFLRENHNKELFGDFQPNINHFEYKENKSVDPSLFLANYLLEQSNNGKKNKEFVFHPDIIFFLTQGERSKEKSVLNSFNNLCKSLNIKMFFENVYFSRQVFRDNFSWMTDPLQLKTLIKDYPKLGLTIDLEHLLNEGWTKERIINTVSSLITELPKRILIHSRENHDVKFPSLYKKCVSKGVPWINEKGKE